MIFVASGLLSGTFSAFIFVRNRVEKLKINQLQITRLMNRCEDLIKYADMISQKVNIKDLAEELENLLKDIEVFIAEHSKCQLLQRVLNADGFHRSLRDFNERLTFLADSIECQLFRDSDKIREQDDQDRKIDNEQIMNYLKELEFRENKLIDALELREEQYMEALYIMEKRMKTIKNDVEKQFLLSASSCIQRLSGQQASKQKWLIPQWEVTLKHKIASGGYGDIYMGEWIRASVAIKVMRKTDKREERIKDFVNEVELCFILNHPNVLNLFGACHTVEKPFMVFEFMSNGHLIQYIKKYPNQSIRCLKEAGVGMRYLHENDVIHGDLKAINILVNGDGIAKVSDFGFSFIKNEKENDDLAIGGTLRWMAPELIRKEKPDFPIDIYAFGMTIYEIFNNFRPPYCGDSDDRVKDLILKGGLPARLLVPSIWPIIEKCLRFDPLERPTFVEIVDELSKLPERDVAKPPSASSATTGTSVRGIPSSARQSMATIGDGDSIIQFCENLFQQQNAESVRKGIDILYRQAKDGNIKAQMKLGDMHSRGTILNQDMNIALEYFKAAAESNLPLANFRLGYFYIKQYFPKNLDKGFYYLRKAADQGNPSAMNFFGKEIQNSRPLDAFQWFLLAANENYIRAYLNLGECYLKGIGTQQNIPKAIESLTIAAEQSDNPAAWKLLGEIYANLLNIKDVEPFVDVPKSIFCLKSAINLGYTDAYIELSQIFFHGYDLKMTRQQRLSESMNLLLAAVEKNVIPAYYLIGKSYEKGLHQPSDREKALEYYRMGANLNCQKCLQALNSNTSSSMSFKKFVSKSKLVGKVSMAFK
eukprot:NODE_247_length_12991_cov_0.678328.p1 type:complete len:820 gc:universal NODE_247_length_12991_cov_0.678328:6757-9216(+)